ncbi:MAG: DNA repair protein RecO [Candidatus Nomurabacteria bacterium]|nr:MAG: DNA repair protein RecO [Candidatus Nomurabacteria bacterium]
MSLTTETHAIVLERRPLREHDRRIVVFTKELGKLELIAKGTQKISSKLAGSLEPLSEIRLHIARGRFDRVIGSVMLHSLAGLRNNLDAFAAANFLAQVVTRLTQPNHPDLELFTSLRQSLLDMDAQPEQASPIVRRFLWKLFTLLGLQPRLDICARCGKDLGQESYYSADAGGALCAKCAKEQVGAFALPDDVRQQLLALHTLDTEVIPREANDLVAKVIEQTLRVQLGAKLPTEYFWVQMRKVK